MDPAILYAYILAGGKSSRFGTNKALVPLSGQPLIRKLAIELSEIGWEVSVVARSELDYTDLGLRCIPDRVQDSGPLVGLATALQDCSDRSNAWCLVTTCDLIQWDPAWSECLTSGLMESRQRGLDLQIVSLSSNDFLPFPALFRANLLSTIDSLWASGSRSLRSLFEAVSSQILCVQCASAGPPRSFNTPHELEKLLGNQNG